MVLCYSPFKRIVFFLIMCFFPIENPDIKSVAYRKGVRLFDCGGCPECLRKRSSGWALRSVYECKSHLNNCMVTLTYDTFKYNERGECVGENPVNPNLEVNKRHIQLFVKRLRKWYSSVTSERIKYICCAEYGSRTHRAHYHLILFGVKFPDIHYYKKSKRGNVIYMSNILTRLWGHGICTVDSINVHSGVARYCTKYCAKSRSDKTFMLCSQGIGIDNLLKDFNGISYFIDGREYPIPRAVWNKYITLKYPQYSDDISFKYVNKPSGDFWIFDDCAMKAYEDSKNRRKAFFAVRDCDPVYMRYLDYWRVKGSIFELNKPSVLTRINLLDDRKYHNYKTSARNCYFKRLRFIPVIAPNSNCKSHFYHWLSDNVGFCPRVGHLPLPSRPNKASDTNKRGYWLFCPFDNKFFTENMIIPLTKSFNQSIMFT